MAFDLCSNANCIWAMWCKRFTYKTSFEKQVLENPQEYPEHDFNCQHGEHYIMNVSRKMYERDNNVSIYDEFEDRRHLNNNRKSGVRKDNGPGTESGRPNSAGNRASEDCLSVVFECSGGRSTDALSESTESGNTERTEKITGLRLGLVRQLWDFLSNNQVQEVQPQGLAIFSNDTLHVLSSPGADIGTSYDREEPERIFGSGTPAPSDISSDSDTRSSSNDNSSTDTRGQDNGYNPDSDTF